MIALSNGFRTKTMSEMNVYAWARWSNRCVLSSDTFNALCFVLHICSADICMPCREASQPTKVVSGWKLRRAYEACGVSRRWALVGDWTMEKMFAISVKSEVTTESELRNQNMVCFSVRKLLRVLSSRYGELVHCLWPNVKSLKPRLVKRVPIHNRCNIRYRLPHDMIDIRPITAFACRPSICKRHSSTLEWENLF